ncbi:MAG: cysteine peptidase family C39 domain-containing protein, partial [Isosphaeraceae bacterium]
EIKKTLRQVELALPAPREGGYSLKDLQVALGKLGIPVRGVILRRQAASIDRPFLIHLRRGDHGHFLTIRPVGHSGNLVQLLDSLHPPMILDKDDLIQSPEWTGLALVKSEASTYSTLAWALSLVCLCAGLAGIVQRYPNVIRFIRRRPDSR